VVYGGVIELNAQVSAPIFHLIGCEIGAIISDDAVRDTITMYHARYEVITGRASVVFTGLASIHLVNLSTITSKYFFLWLPPLRGPTISNPQAAKGQVMGIVLKAVGGI